VRRCRDFAASQHWGVSEDYVRFDEAKSAASLAGRDALKSLLEDAKRKPTPFDCVLVDDTSRLARYLPDVLR
jgi:DNA invertase Pin-like site-specific DNA recombinase